MVKSRDESLDTVRRFIDEAKRKLKIKKVVLFGSSAKGDTHQWSDIDIAVISDDFTGMTYKERLLILKRIAWDAKTTEIDALGYTEEEFSVEDPLNLVHEIKEHGRVIYENHQL